MLGVDPVVAPKVARLIVESLKAEILAGHVVPGTALPPPDELARRFGVSRPTVREALNVLELQGLVRLKRGPKGGAIVRLPDHAALTSALGDLLKAEGTTLSHLWEVRLVLEPTGARLAAPRIGERDIEALEASVQRQWGLVDDAAAWMRENLVFHGTITRAAENPVLKAFMDALQDLIFREGVASAMTAEHRRQSTQEHASILGALRRRDAERAEAELRTHLATSVVIAGQPPASR